LVGEWWKEEKFIFGEREEGATRHSANRTWFYFWVEQRVMIAHECATVRVSL